ncbi:hypothetical protein P8452_49075 [Trifolium repens]|nr:hypothetical protein P8452_49075 [Trifolium repens]
MSRPLLTFAANTTTFPIFFSISDHILSFVAVDSGGISNYQPFHYAHLLKLSLPPRRSPQTTISILMCAWSSQASLPSFKSDFGVWFRCTNT